MESLRKKFGKRLKEIRNNRDLTQDELAERIDFQPKSIGQIETGKSFVSAETIEKLCDTLKISPRALFDFTELKHRKNDKERIEEIITRLNEVSSAKIKDIHSVVFALTK